MVKLVSAGPLEHFADLGGAILFIANKRTLKSLDGVSIAHDTEQGV